MSNIRILSEVAFEDTTNGRSAAYVIQLQRHKKDEETVYKTVCYFGKISSRLRETVKFNGFSMTQAQDAYNKAHRDRINNKGYQQVKGSWKYEGVPSESDLNAREMEGSVEEVDYPLSKKAQIDTEPGLKAVDHYLNSVEWIMQQAYRGTGLLISVCKGKAKIYQLSPNPHECVKTMDKMEISVSASTYHSYIQPLLDQWPTQEESILEACFYHKTLIYRDIIKFNGQDVRSVKLSNRLTMLTQFTSCIKHEHTEHYQNSSEKWSKFRELEGAGADGVIFRPASETYELDVHHTWQFWHAAHLRVLSINKTGMARLGVLSDHGFDEECVSCQLPGGSESQFLDEIVNVKWNTTDPYFPICRYVSLDKTKTEAITRQAIYQHIHLY